MTESKPTTTPQLEISRRLLGSSTIVSQNPGARDISVALDVESFVRRILLFDTYILYSARLKEIPELVRHFGYQGTMTLLGSGAVEIRCECAQFAEGQISTPVCPPLTFQFHVIEAHNRDQYLIDNLSEVNRTPGLTAHELMALREAVMKVIQQPDNRRMFSSSVAPAFEADVLHNVPLLKSALRLVLAREKGIPSAGDFELHFHKVGDDRYKAETTLVPTLNCGIEEVHKLIKTAVLAVSGVNQRIGEMQVHTALSGFASDELPFFRSKLESIADAIGSHGQERRFERIVSIAGLPHFSDFAQVDIEKVLEIRNESEALEFRGWLAGIDKASDSEIRQRTSSLNARLGLAVSSGTGKLLRFLITCAAGFVPQVGPALGPGLSALDAFAWDKFARRSGIAAFVHELYPSIFSQR